MAQHMIHEIDHFRKEKDSFFRSDDESPIPESERPKFQGLKYYPPDAVYQAKALLTKYENPATVTMTTSKGTIRPYQKYGVFSFQVEGKKLQLIAYKAADNPSDQSLFVPFTDETSGKETYGSGRYLDIEELEGDDYVLDFNLAYNPYCAYNENYTCPFPGRENRLPIPVRAGEKNYKVKENEDNSSD